MKKLTIEEIEELSTISKNKPFFKNGYYYIQRKKKKYKRSRIFMQLFLGKKLESWELVHHKDGNKTNDSIDNLQVLNCSEHNAQHHNYNNKKPEGWKPANTTDSEVIGKIKEIASKMIKINCSEISRQLKKDGIKITSMTIKRYL